MALAALGRLGRIAGSTFRRAGRNLGAFGRGQKRVMTDPYFKGRRRGAALANLKRLGRHQRHIAGQGLREGGRELQRSAPGLYGHAQRHGRKYLAGAGGLTAFGAGRGYQKRKQTRGLRQNQSGRIGPY